jgi:ribose transport system ATP-binding protein
MGETDFLVMRNIRKSFDVTQALRGVDFSAVKGEVHAIVGENGAGKSTLMKILSGALQRDSGEVYLEGEAADLSSPISARRLGIRAVYQEFSLVPHLSVTENILMGQMPTRGLPWWVDWPAAHRQAENVLADIGFAGVDVRTPVSRLSVSHQQMVEIAKAAATRPRVWILDEPSAVLSQEELNRLFAMIRDLKTQDTLVLYISHRLDEVFEVADRITVLKDGQLVGTVRPQETDQAELIRMMVGRKLSEIYPHRNPPRADVLLEVSGLCRSGGFEDISVSLRHGEIVGLFGLVGSGRTAVARAIFGAEPAESGSLQLGRKMIRPLTPRQAVGEGIALLTEDRKRDGLVMSCSIRDNVSLPSYEEFSRWKLIDRRRQDEVVGGKLKELDVRPPEPGRVVRYLSGGNQQKVVMAKWLLTDARVLILDEPTRGVDVATKVEFYQLMGALADNGIGILLISSELPEILGMSDRVVVMRDGRIVGEFSRAQANEETILACAAGVMA